MTGGLNDTIIVKKTIGKNIQKAREQKKLSRKELAKKLSEFKDRPIINSKQEEMSEDRLKKWEYGENAINTEWIPLLCKALDCDVGYLFGEYEEKKREISDVCVITGLSERAIANLLHFKDLSQVGNLFYLGEMFCLSSSKEETPVWIINSLIEDAETLQLLYLFFVTESMDKEEGIFKHARSNAILIELIGNLTSKRNDLEKLLQLKKGEADNG